MWMTPFSGLSPIAHLIIIGIGKIIDILRERKMVKKLVMTTRIVKKRNMILGNWFHYGVSSIIVTILFSSILLFFGIAIKTSIREGVHEWQRERARDAWVSIESYVEKALPHLTSGDIFHSIINQ